jgi:hypothetical protein
MVLGQGGHRNDAGVTEVGGSGAGPVHRSGRCDSATDRIFLKWTMNAPYRPVDRQINVVDLTLAIRRFRMAYNRAIRTYREVF